MNFAFIHQNMPGQFGRIATSLAEDPRHRVAFITMHPEARLPGVQVVQYKPAPDRPPDFSPWLNGLHAGSKRGVAVANALLGLKRDGFTPDIVLAHAGWGESLFVKDVLPLVPLLTYCEFYYHAAGSDVGFDLDEAVTDEDRFRIRVKNAVGLVALETCDAGLSPTKWQHRQYPKRYQPKISVIHDGIDVDLAKPDPGAFIRIGELTLDRTCEVVTFVNRTLEPYRGFPTFLHAVARLQRRRPNTHFLIIGGEKGGYGRRPEKGSYKQQLLREVQVDPARTHFLGRVPYQTFLKVLQISSAHVYLTRPFVLSWSMLEAMAAECLVVGSRTPPVTEVIRDEENGLLVDFFAPDELADTLDRVLAEPARYSHLRRAARRTILERYELQDCHRQLKSLMQRLVEGSVAAFGKPAEILAVAPPPTAAAAS